MLPKVDMLPTSPAPALDILKDTRRLERVTVPKAAVRPAPAATPEPTFETLKDAKPDRSLLSRCQSPVWIPNSPIVTPRTSTPGPAFGSCSQVLVGRRCCTSGSGFDEGT